MAAFESKKFSWRKGYSYKVSADTVGNVLDSIEKKDGTVTASSFLDYSRDERVETHSMFEWDDTLAAEKYRHRQAQQIINQLEVHIEYEQSNPEDAEVRIVTASAFMNVNRKAPAEQGVFMNAFTVLGDDELRKQVLRNAFMELDAFSRKYVNINGLEKIFAAIEETKRELDGVV